MKFLLFHKFNCAVLLLGMLFYCHCLNAKGEGLNLEKAIRLTLKKNPELKTYRHEIRAMEGRVIQAGLLPNPELSLQSEDFGGSNHFEGMDGAEHTIEMSQSVALGYRRLKARKAASYEVKLAWLDYESKRLDLIRRVKKDFTELLSVQLKLELAQELAGLAEEVLKAVSERVKAGKVSPLEEAKAKVSFSQALIEKEKNEHALRAACKRLASYWAESSASFNAIGDFEFEPRLSSYEELTKRLSKNPDIYRWSREMKYRKSALDLEMSKKWPDIRFGGGMRYHNETDDHAFVAGISIPLPLFNRNQGSVLETREKLKKVKEDRHAAWLRVGIELSEAHKEYSIALRETDILKNDILPAAKLAFEAAQEGYRQGKLNYLDVLDAQRTLFESRIQYVEARAAYHKAVADVERLIGEPVLTDGNAVSNQRSGK